MKTAESFLKRHWSADVLAFFLKTEPEKLSGPARWQPFYQLVPNFILYILFGLLATILHLLMPPIWSVVLHVQRLRRK